MAEKWHLTALMVFAVITLALGEASIARGMRQSAAEGWWALARSVATNPWAIAGGLLLASHLLIYATALSRADLSFVMPITAASYPIGTLLARFFLHEQVSFARWLGTVVIAVGVAVVAWGEAESAL